MATAPRSNKVSRNGSVGNLKAAKADPSADFVQDIAEAAPPKDIKTVKAASDVAEKGASDTARFEKLAREHGSVLSEEGFNEALEKFARREPKPVLKIGSKNPA